VHSNLQLEVINLKCNSVVKARFMELAVCLVTEDVCSFCNLLPDVDYASLRSFAQRMIIRFGSTYRCEQSFSSLKLLENRNRSRLTNVQLSNLMVLVTTLLQPDINKLASALQLQKRPRLLSL